MSTVDFINRNFSKHMKVPLTNRPEDDAYRALTKAYDQRSKSGEVKSRRLANTGIILREGKLPVITANLVGLNVEKPEEGYSKACADALTNFEGPAMFIWLSQRGIKLSNCFVTYDPRNTRFCEPEGVEAADMTQPAPKDAGKIVKSVAKIMRSKQGA